jgi:hypothetical protein
VPVESSLIGLGGALIGIVLGHFLTRSAQHRQWLRDNRKEEFREVVTAMSQFIVGHMAYVSSLGSDLPQSKQAYIDSYKTTSVILCDRVYIYADINDRNIPHRFLQIAEKYREAGSDFDKVNNEAGELLQELITLARKG